MRNLKSKGLFIFLCVILLLALPGDVFGQALSVSLLTITPAAAIQLEGRDFATLVLRDPWDMSEFTDISQYLNQSGQVNLLDNISVANSIFSAHVTALKQATFHVLFPGYKNGLLVGKVGHIYPIDAVTYKCIYIAAKVDSGPPQYGAPDQMVVYWFANEELNNGTWGLTVPGIWMYPEAGAGTPTPRWKLYNLRLDQAEVPAGYTRWENAPNGLWQGLRIDATLQETNFQIDWVRLTDCNAVTFPITWSGSGNVSVSVIPTKGPDRDILMIASTQDKQINLDVQGLEPGTYTYYVKQGSATLASSIFTVKKMPIAKFEKPSFTSGTDYATQNGNSWDMTNAADVVSTQCMQSNMANGVLQMDTVSVESQPDGCNGGGQSDPGVFLSEFEPADTTQYRFLTFKMYTEGPWQNVPNAMIVRWVWYIQATTGLPDDRCILVSGAVPYDVGWQTYTVDLHDPIDGAAVQTSELYCPPGRHWLDTGPVLEMRLDPNENIMGQTMHQKLDWVLLTKMDEVVHGSTFPIQVSLNMPWSELEYYELYYTDNLQAPKQHLVQLENIYPPPPLQGNLLFLPLLMNAYSGGDLLVNTQTFNWNTSNVQPGEYYLCIDIGFADPELEHIHYCSEAPMIVR